MSYDVSARYVPTLLRNQALPSDQGHQIRPEETWHRNITSATIYENSLPNQEVDTYVSKVAGSDEDKLKLLNLGYEYSGLNTTEGLPIMRKKVVGFD